MEKMKMQSIDGVQSNIEKIEELFPNCITEALDLERSTSDKPVYKKAINMEILQQMLSNDIADGSEKYEMTWVGKKAAIVEANRPIRKTLRPFPEESVDWNTTSNIYIEGDNLDVLKLIQESYLGKIKMIYIDPPYNTGQDFIYHDNFSIRKDEFQKRAGEKDEIDDTCLIKNTDSNGRFHSDWDSMIYSRLLLARNLLTPDGFIFISIDDYEVNSLMNICNEVFGENNFVTNFIWKRRVPSALSGTNWSVDHEYVVCYRKSDLGDFRGNDKSYESYKNPDNDPRGPWMADNLTVGMTATQRPNQAYDLVDPKTGKVYPFNPNRVWAFIPESMEKMIQDNRIVFPEDTTKRPMQKRFKNELKKQTDPFSSIMIDKVGLNSEATRQIQKIFGKNYFSYSKPLSLLDTLISQICTDDDDIVLDFFSGSATTAHSVLNLNSEDGIRRKFIMVQLQEKCDEKSDAYKNGYKNICEIGKERIRRVGKEYSNQLLKIDVGFRVFKTDESNFKDVYFHPDDYTQGGLLDLETNIKEDRSDLDLFFGCVLDWGLQLSLPYKTENIGGFTIHNYNDGDLIACFDENVSEELIREVASRKPIRAVFRDSSFGNSPEKINVFEIFKKYMPEDADDITRRVKVI